MMQAAFMAKDQMFKLRLDAEDRARLDRIAEHYATSHAASIRMLLKREDDAISTRSSATPKRKTKRE